MILSPKTITFLVIPFLDLRDIATSAKDLLLGTVFALIKSTFSEESFATSAVLPVCGAQSTYFVIASSSAHPVFLFL